MRICLAARARSAAIRGAQVKLSLNARESDRETKTAAPGEFSFRDVTPGPYRLSFDAKGFAPKTVTGELHAGETLNLAPTALAIENLVTDINVTQTPAEIAEAEIKLEEQQRFLGVLPNFFVAYDHDAAPLNAKQKLELTARSWFDPSSFVVEGIAAGVGQAQNSHKGFGQGAQGYAKRYGAGLADYGTHLLIDRVVTTTIFKQDPRYFYRGTGTTSSRFFYAVSRSVICRGDNKKDQFCFSSVVGRFATPFITNYYFPAADRDRNGVILRNAAMGIGFQALGDLFQEFVAPKITHRKH